MSSINPNHSTVLQVSAPVAIENSLHKAANSVPLDNAAWITTWRASSLPSVPKGVDSLYLFVGELQVVSGHLSISGLQGVFSNTNSMKEYVQNCKAEGVKVCISIGGGGGSYDDTWNILNNAPIEQYGKDLADYCTQYGIAGIDFDWEQEYATEAEKKQGGNNVGQLIKYFKEANPDLQASLDSNAASSWQQQASYVFDMAKDDQGTCLIDRLNIMAYYPPESGVEGWMNSWATWIAGYGLDHTHLTLGMDPNAYGADKEEDIKLLAEFCKTNDFSTSLWFWDPANEASSNDNSEAIQNAYDAAKEVDLKDC